MPIRPIADLRHEEPGDAAQTRDETAPSITGNFTVIDEDDQGGVLLIEFTWSNTNWLSLAEQDRPVEFNLMLSTTSSQCESGSTPTVVIGLADLAAAPSEIRLEELDDHQQYTICVEVVDWRGNAIMLGPLTGTPTPNEAPEYLGGLEGGTVYVGVRWTVDLCQYFNDVETPCTDLDISASDGRIGFYPNNTAYWTPAPSDTIISNLRFTVIDGDHSIASQNFTLGVEVQQPDSTDDQTEEGLILDLPVFGEVNIALDSLVGTIGSILLGVLTIGAAIYRTTSGRRSKKRVSVMLRKITVAKTQAELVKIGGEIDQLFTDHKISDSELNVLNQSLDRRRAVLKEQQEFAASRTAESTPTSEPKPEPESIDEVDEVDMVPPGVKGEIRDDGFEWVQYPLDSKIWWFKKPDGPKWKRWKD